MMKGGSIGLPVGSPNPLGGSYLSNLVVTFMRSSDDFGKTLWLLQLHTAGFDFFSGKTRRYFAERAGGQELGQRAIYPCYP